jgi:transposase
MKKLRLVPVEDQGQKGPQRGQDVYVAIDLSRRKWVYGLRWGGELRRRWSSPAGLEHVHAVVKEYAGCRLHVVYEACGFGYEIAWWLEEQPEVEVTVIAPSRVARVPGPRVKTDGTDVREMACKLEGNQLKAIFVPRRPEHQRRQLSRTYAQVMKECKRARVRLRSLLQEQGLVGPEPKRGWAAYQRWLAQQDLAPPLALCVRELLEVRQTARHSAACLKQAILDLSVQPEYRAVVAALSEQPGVGAFTAMRFVLEVGDIQRFATADSIANYLGLTPSQYSSGPIDHRGHVLKASLASVRGWLVQCAWASLDADVALTRCFERLAPRIGRKRAIVAVARRLSVRLRARWLEVLRSQAAELPAAAAPGSMAAALPPPLAS